MKRILTAAALLGVLTIGLTACDPPVPAEIQAIEFEKKHVCIDGEAAVAAPAKLAGVVATWGEAQSQACEATTITVSVSDALQNTSVTSGAKASECTSGYTFPFAVDAGVMTFTLTDVVDLRLSPKTLAAILAGQITSWNDDSILAGQKLNADAVLEGSIYCVGDSAHSARGSWVRNIEPCCSARFRRRFQF